jgi:hypothetical protein
MEAEIKAKSEDEDWDDSIASESDSNTKLQRLLESGDNISDSYNCARILGLDLSGKVNVFFIPTPLTHRVEGILLLCSRAIYLIEGYIKRSDGKQVVVLYATDYLTCSCTGEMVDIESVTTEVCPMQAC